MPTDSRLEAHLLQIESVRRLLSDDRQEVPEGGTAPRGLMSRRALMQPAFCPSLPGLSPVVSAALANDSEGSSDA